MAVKEIWGKNEIEMWDSLLVVECEGWKIQWKIKSVVEVDFDAVVTNESNGLKINTQKNGRWIHFKSLGNYVFDLNLVQIQRGSYITI